MAEMTPQVALFRADATPTLGGGHISRCLALADGLSRVGWSCVFAGVEETPQTTPQLAQSGHRFIALSGVPAAEPEELRLAVPGGVDLVVVDHYDRGEPFEAACRPWARQVMAIDDVGGRTHDCDVVLDQMLGTEAADYSDAVPGGCDLLIGPRNILLRREFPAAREAALSRRDGRSGIHRVFVNFGATDSPNVSAKVLEGCRRLEQDFAVDLVLGAAAPHLDALRAVIREMGRSARLHTGIDATEMARLMSAADVAIGAAGETAWERCCLGLPSLIVILADNQAVAANALADAGAARLIGWHEAVTPDAIAEALAVLLADAEAVRAMSAAARDVCDGSGVARAVKILKSRARAFGERVPHLRSETGR